MKRRTLPKRVYLKHGAYFFVDHAMKWHNLGRESAGLPCMYRALASVTEKLKQEGMMPEAVTEWLDDPRHKWSAKHRKECEAMGVIISASFREFHCRDVTAPDIAEFLESWATKPRMHNRYKTCLGQILKKAELKGWRSDHNPAKQVPGLEASGRDRVVTEDEISAIKRAAMVGKDGLQTDSGPALVRMIDIALITGQRIGDMINMRWQDVTDDGLIVNQRKGSERCICACSKETSSCETN